MVLPFFDHSIRSIEEEALGDLCGDDIEDDDGGNGTEKICCKWHKAKELSNRRPRAYERK